MKWKSYGPCGDKQNPVGPQNAPQVRDRATPISDVLEHLGTDDQVKRLVAKMLDQIIDIANLVHAWSRHNVNA